MNLLPSKTDEDYRTTQPFKVKGKGPKDIQQRKKHSNEKLPGPSFTKGQALKQ